VVLFRESKKEKYDLDENELRPYFKLENVRQGAFDVATKLYGIQFTELPDMPIYHKDVLVYEVTEADGSHIGIYIWILSKSKQTWWCMDDQLQKTI